MFGIRRESGVIGGGTSIIAQVMAGIERGERVVDDETPDLDLVIRGGPSFYDEHGLDGRKLKARKQKKQAAERSTMGDVQGQTGEKSPLSKEVRDRIRRNRERALALRRKAAAKRAQKQQQ